jgi:hypothetical protein
MRVILMNFGVLGIEKLLKKKEVPMIRLKDGSLIPATALGGAATAQSIIGGEKTGIKSLV